MVLKVVRGKILITLELASGPACCSIASAPRGLAGSSIWSLRGGEIADELSEIGLSLRKSNILYIITIET